ncbi:MAG TPA: glycine cleavage system protein GcvH [Dehalococcoidia bacterium]|nr:glycine cleavage system protein GcvH [Dehalococcoidia bacterium]
MPSPADRRYSKEHEWIMVDGDSGTVGITDYAQDQLGDIVFVDLPAPGTAVRYMEKFGEIESVKAVSELFSPVTGKVTDVNAALNDNPQYVNDSPYAEGWMAKVRLSDMGELDKLMAAEQYDEYIRELS